MPTPVRRSLTESVPLRLRPDAIRVPQWWLPLLSLLVGVTLALEVLSLWRGVWYLGVDFHAYEAAAHVGLQSGWTHIYDQDLIRGVESRLVPDELPLRFVSPPPVAWLVAGLAPLPHWTAYAVWAGLMLAALMFALAWSTTYRGCARLVGVGVGLAPWWVMHALYVGQVVPLVAASILVGWRLVRMNRDVWAGIVLSLILLKPHTAIVVPLALLAAGRVRAFAAWVGCAAVLAGTSLLAIDSHGLASYLSFLSTLPPNSSDITLQGVLGLTRPASLLSAAAVIGASLVIAYRFRSVPGAAMAAAVLASLLASPYLYENDLCLLGAAGWMLWIEYHSSLLRGALAAIWVVAATHLAVTGIGGLGLKLWPPVELVLLMVLGIMAIQSNQLHASPDGLVVDAATPRNRPHR